MANRELPILMNPAMANATVQGKKTVTRRLIDPQPLVLQEVIPLPMDVTEFGEKLTEYANKGYTQIYTGPHPLSGMIGPKCRWQVGDWLWVKEVHYKYGRWISDGLTKTGELKYKFVADEKKDVLFSTEHKALGETFVLPVEKNSHRLPGWYKRSGLFMEKKDARTWLEVVSVTQEAVRSITNIEAIDEGVMTLGDDFIKEMFPAHWELYSEWLKKKEAGSIYKPPIGPLPALRFEALWKSINGEDSWEANPFVDVIGFKVLSTTGKANIVL